MTQSLFKSKPVKIETLGACLRQIREKLNLDIKTVSLLSQIKPVYLEDLEVGDYDKLPSDVYVRGFIKNLSQLYRIDETALIEQYEKEHGFNIAHTRRAKVNYRKIWFTPRRAIAAVSVLIFLVAFIYVFTQISSVLTPPKLMIDEPPTDETVMSNSIVVAGRAEIGSDVSINNQTVLTDPSGSFNENVILGNGLNLIEVVAKNKFNKVSRVTRRINAQIAQSSLPVPLEINLRVEVGPNPAWVSVEVDGIVMQRGTMLSGSSKNFSAKENIILTSANAGSTKIIYNGKDLGALGREGEVIRNVEFGSQSSVP